MGNRYYPINGKELASVTTITGLADKSDALIPWAVGCAVDWIQDKLPKMAESRIWARDAKDLSDEARTKWREVRDEAGHIGTMVHDALEEYLLDWDAYSDTYSILLEERKSDIPVVKRCAEMAVSLIRAAFQQLESIGPYKVLSTEQKVVNEDEWYAGRFDALLEVNGETWLIDFKTGGNDKNPGQFYDEWGMQLAAYAEAYVWERNFNAIGEYLESIPQGAQPPYLPMPDMIKEIDRIKVLRLDKKTLKAHWKEYGGEKDTLTRDNYMTAFKGLRDAFYILKAKKAVKLAWLGR